MKIATVVGARPQFIKIAAVSRVIQQHSDLNEIILHTGQHYDANMSDIFFDELSIPKPQYHLGIGGLGHGAMTGQMLEKLENIFIQEKPDLVLVYGDTNSTLAGALAAKKLGIKLAHIEAGLRSFNMAMPEEINRILTDRISDFLFCPTQTAVDNLTKEGFENFKTSIKLCGDVMYDAALFYAKIAKDKSQILEQIKSTSYILATIHRQENTDDFNRLRAIVNALNKINEEIAVVCPLHPRTKKMILNQNIKINFKTIEPVGYLDMVQLLTNCQMVITDSGGLQKEAYFFNKPSLILRDQTEWVELVQKGFAFLAGADEDQILNLFNKNKNLKINNTNNLYGDGRASEKIVQTIKVIS